MKKRRVVVIVEYKNLSQCQPGLKYLKDDDFVEVIGIYIRNHCDIETQRLLKRLTEQEIDVALIGGNCDQNLPGYSDAYLRYVLNDKKIVVVGVAFEDKAKGKHAEPAVFTIVPGTQVIYREGDDQATGQNVVFTGQSGFLRACMFAIKGKLPKIELLEFKDPTELTMDEALDLASQ